MRQVVECGAFRAEVEENGTVHLSMPNEVVAQLYEKVGGRSWMDWVKDDYDLLMIKLVFNDVDRLMEKVYAV